MGSKATQESLAGRNGDGLVRGGGGRVPSLTTNDATSPIEGPNDNPSTEAMDNPRRSPLVGFRAEVRVPVGPVPASNWYPSNIHVTLTRRQGIALRRLREGLQDADEQTADGRLVRDWTKTIRWMLEKIADEAEKA